MSINKNINNRNNRPTILVDLDDTVAHFLDGVYKERSSNKKSYPNLNEFVNGLKNQEKNAYTIVNEYKQPGSRVFSHLEVIKGAKEALDLMDKLGYNVFLVSSPTIANSYSFKDKCDWVKNHLGDTWAHRLILSKDKTLIRGDILIDDKVEITGAMIPTWTHVLFQSKFNNHVKRDFILKSWNTNEWLSIIEEILDL